MIKCTNNTHQTGVERNEIPGNFKLHIVLLSYFNYGKCGIQTHRMDLSVVANGVLAVCCFSYCIRFGVCFHFFSNVFQIDWGYKTKKINMIILISVLFSITSCTIPSGIDQNESMGSIDVESIRWNDEPTAPSHIGSDEIAFRLKRLEYDWENKRYLPIPAGYLNAACSLQIGCRGQFFEANRFDGVKMSFPDDSTVCIFDKYGYVRDWILKLSK